MWLILQIAAGVVLGGLLLEGLRRRRERKAQERAAREAGREFGEDLAELLDFQVVTRIPGVRRGYIAAFHKRLSAVDDGDGPPAIVARAELEIFNENADAIVESVAAIILSDLEDEMAAARTAGIDSEISELLRDRIEREVFELKAEALLIYGEKLKEIVDRQPLPEG